jgi:hypothetical protein
MIKKWRKNYKIMRNWFNNQTYIQHLLSLLARTKDKSIYKISLRRQHHLSSKDLLVFNMMNLYNTNNSIFRFIKSVLIFKLPKSKLN